MIEVVGWIRERLATHSWLQALVILTLVAALLSPALRAEFLWDDFKQIVDSPTIGDLSRVPFYFTHNVVQSAGGEGRGADGVDTYRPLFMVALSLVYRINGPDPFWFHLALLATHLAVCWLLWKLAVRWLDSPVAAALAVFFFACHPVTAEAYLWPSALPEPLAAAGLLGTVLVLDRQTGVGREPLKAWTAAVVAGVLFLAALFAKEVVLAALPGLALYLLTVRKIRIGSLLPAVVATGLFLVARTSALAGFQATGAGNAQRLEALKVYPVLLLDGLRAILTMQPIGVRHLSWEYAAIDWGASAAAAVGCMLVLCGAVALRRIAPLSLAAVIVGACMLLPIALVATVPGWGGFGRYLYVPLAMTSLALAELGLVARRRLVEHQRHLRWAIPAIMATALVVELGGLHRALWVYANQENLARAAIEIYPDGPDGWEWLGNVYLDRGDLEAARECYREATARGPELFRPRHNLAAALLYTGRPAAALEQLEILESMHPPTAPGSRVAVMALIQLGRWQEAAERLVEGLDRNPDYAPLAEEAERLLAEHPRPDALRAWLAATIARPEHRGAASVLGPMLEE